MTNFISLIGAKLAPVVSGLKQHSPQILLGVGIATAVGSVAAAVVATTKLDAVKAEVVERLEEVDEALQDETLKDRYGEEDAANDRKIIKIQGGAKIAAMYLPAAALLACSIAAFVGGHHILMLRNGALTAACATISAMFENYRKNVAKAYGAEVDAAMRRGASTNEYVELTVDEDGAQHTLTKSSEVSNVDEAYDFARYYIGSDMNNMHDLNYDEMFLRTQQTMANELLQAKHILLLNDVYELLGFKKTKAGAVVGWINDARKPYGDNYVDFRMHLTCHPDKAGELQPAYFLDFNAAGSVLDAAVERGLLDA